MKKIFNFTTDREEIRELIDNLPAFYKIVFTNGCFDMLHTNHINLLNESKKLGDILMVGMNSDSTTEQLKGKGRPIINEGDRAFMLSNINSVDYVIVFDDYSVENLIKFIEPNIITKGGEYKVEDLDHVGGNVMKKTGGDVIIIQNRKNISTTDIIKKIIKTYA